jgi:hypothetical protein
MVWLADAFRLGCPGVAGANPAVVTQFAFRNCPGRAGKICCAIVNLGR